MEREAALRDAAALAVAMVPPKPGMTLTAKALVGVADFHVVIGDEQVALVALRTRGGKFSHASFSGRLVSLLGKSDVWCRSPGQQNADQAKKESRPGEIPSVRAVIQAAALVKGNSWIA